MQSRQNHRYTRSTPSSSLRSKRRRTRSAAALHGCVPPVSSVQKKVRKLRRLIPGGEGMNTDRLFLRTADYIVQLRMQLHVLQALSDVVCEDPAPDIADLEASVS